MIPPEGSLETAKLIIVGEQPGKEEVWNNRPFIGPAGRMLMEIVQSTNLTRQDLYLTNTFKDLDHPLEYYWKNKRGTPVFTAAGNKYVDVLRSELRNTHQPIVVAGNVPLSALLGFTGITKWRGSILQSPWNANQYIVPMIHPATIIPPKNVYTNKLLCQFDLQRAKLIAEGNYVPTQRRILDGRNFDNVLCFLLKCKSCGLKLGHVVFFDIEIYNEEVSCISLGLCEPNDPAPYVAMSIPFVDHTGDKFLATQEAAIWLEIASILESPSIRKGGQNLTFDSHFLLRKYGIKGKNFDDTMIAQRTLMPDYPIGLDFITSIWTDHRYYKDEGKRFFKGGGSWERLWQYNATDSLICVEALPKQLDELQTRNNLPAYDRQRRLIEPLTFMMERGIRVDVEGMKREGTRMDSEAEELQIQLNVKAGKPLNPSSPKQLQEYFYKHLGFAPYKKRGGKNNSITTDNDAMKRLARKGVEEAKLIQRIRKLRKLRSTYLNLDKIDPDGRLRCSYNPVGTKFSRLSSSENIFGTGMNMQNWPQSTLQFMLADRGFIYYSYDLAQAENRLVAYVGNVEPMIDAFEGGLDVHRLTAALIFQKPVDEISDEPGSCRLGDGTHDERFWGKKANHGLNYDLGYRTFAFYYEIPENDAKFIVDRYHLAYPGVRQSFHALVRRMLGENRTVTNLMGRKTMFLDEWGDALFKEAYSCIPQGTVGDVINEYGVHKIYYDLGPKTPIELLNQVHDSVGFQLPTTLSWLEHARILQDVKTSLEVELNTGTRKFTIPADLTMGLTFAKETGKEFKHGKWPATIHALALGLENAYATLKDDKRNEAYFK